MFPLFPKSDDQLNWDCGRERGVEGKQISAFPPALNFIDQHNSRGLRKAIKQNKLGGNEHPNFARFSQQ